MAGNGTKLQFKRKRFNGLSGNQLKLIAFILMLMDHIAFAIIENTMLYGNNPVFFNEAIATNLGHKLFILAKIMRFLGRISFPIFCFLIVEGFTHTQSLKNYIKRVGLCAILSEIPFDLAIRAKIFDPTYQNVVFTLLFALMALYFLDKHERANIFIKAVIIAIFAGLSYLFKADYGGIGVILISIMYLLRKDRNICLIVGAVISAIESYSYACFGALAFPIIRLYNGKNGDINLKRAFYIAYPLQFIIIFLISGAKLV